MSPREKSPPLPNRKAARGEALGPIEPAVLYPARVFQARTGLGAWGFREMRRAGLRVLRFNGRAFVRGEDFIAFLEQQESS